MRVSPGAEVNARARRIAQVKFVVLPMEGPAFEEPAKDRVRRASPLAALRNLLIRVIGCLEAARP